MTPKAAGFTNFESITGSKISKFPSRLIAVQTLCCKCFISAPSFIASWCTTNLCYAKQWTCDEISQ